MKTSNVPGSPGMGMDSPAGRAMEIRSPKPQNPKAIRNPKSEGRDRRAFGHWPCFHVTQRPHRMRDGKERPKEEGKRLKCHAVTAPNDGSDADIRISDFGFPSDFGFRISDFPPAFGFRISLRPSDFGLPQLRPPAGAVRIAFLLLLGLACWSSSAATLVPRAPTGSDPTLLQCGNLIYAGNRSSVCFADRFLTDVVDQTCLRVNRKFCPVRLDGEGVFDFPFCVMSGNESFSLSEMERSQVRKFLAQGGFLLVSPGCSDEK